VNFVAITLYVASQRVLIVAVVYFYVIDSARKLLDNPRMEGVSKSFRTGRPKREL
jgi:hypothetical protein